MSSLGLNVSLNWVLLLCLVAHIILIEAVLLYILISSALILGLQFCFIDLSSCVQAFSRFHFIFVELCARIFEYPFERRRCQCISQMIGIRGVIYLFLKQICIVRAWLERNLRILNLRIGCLVMRLIIILVWIESLECSRWLRMFGLLSCDQVDARCHHALMN